MLFKEVGTTEEEFKKLKHVGNYNQHAVEFAVKKGLSKEDAEIYMNAHYYVDGLKSIAQLCPQKHPTVRQVKQVLNKQERIAKRKINDPYSAYGMVKAFKNEEDRKSEKGYKPQSSVKFDEIKQKISNFYAHYVSLYSDRRYCTTYSLKMFLDRWKKKQTRNQYGFSNGFDPVVYINKLREERLRMCKEICTGKKSASAVDRRGRLENTFLPRYEETLKSIGEGNVLEASEEEYVFDL